MPQDNPVEQTIQKLLGLLRSRPATPAKPTPPAPAPPSEPTASDFFAEGNARQNRGDNDGAIAMYNEAIRRNPRFGQAYWQRHEAYYNKHDYRGAVNAMTEYLRAFPGDPNIEVIFRIRAQYCAYDGDWAGAVTDFSEALRYNPQNGETYYFRALARQRLGDQAGAQQDVYTAQQLGFFEIDYLPAWAQ